MYTSNHIDKPTATLGGHPPGGNSQGTCEGIELLGRPSRLNQRGVSPAKNSGFTYVV